MKNDWRSMIALAVVLLLSGCQQEEEAPDIAESAEETVVPDRPAPAITDPASPSPVGTDIGTLGRDTSSGPVADDSMAIPGR